MMMTPKLLLPIIWEKLQQEAKTAAVQGIDTDTAEGGLQSAN